MDDGLIQTQAVEGSSGDAGSILVTAKNITLTGGAQIDSRTGGSGRGGMVVVTATDTVSIAGRDRDGNPSGLVSLTSSATAGAGDAGTVLLAAPQVRLADGGQIQTSTSGAGAAGTIAVGAFEQQVEGMTIRGPQVEQVTLTGGAQILSSSGKVDTAGAVVTGSGRGGTVTVTTTDALIIAGHDPTGTVPSGVFSQTFGPGDAGRVAITTGQLRLEDGGRLSVDTGGDGRGGDLTVQARQVTIAGGAQLNSRSGFDVGNNVSLVGAGAGGTVTVTATDTVTITGQASGLSATTAGRGQGGDIALQARAITLTDGALLTADTSGAGNAGRITVTAQELVRTANSTMTTNTRGSGGAGRVAVTAPLVEMTEGRLSAVTSGAGNAGDVVITAGRLALLGQAQIDSSSAGTGQGGQVIVTATDPVLLSGQGTGLFTRTAGPGKGGDITVQAPRITLADGATISAESTGLGNAGNITLTLGDSFQSTNGTIVTRATQADGGNIQITARNFLRLRDSAITAEVGGGATTIGGNIFIDPQFVLLQNSQIVANAFAGQGGNIRIQAQQVFLADPTSQVSASSALGINGQVAIQAPVTNISGAVAPLPQAFARAGDLLRGRCGERVRGGTVSRFVLGGRDGVPREPGSLLLSPLVRAEQPVPVRITDTVEGQREVSFEPVGELESDNTSYLSLRGPHVQAQWLEALDVECARWRWMQETDVKTVR
jgi:large exoprotein involved in heme utilization and adhesion